MILYEQYYRRNGLRLPAQLMVPFMPALEKFEFPRDSIHHYVVLDSVLNGPPSDEYIYRDIDKKIMMEHVTTLVGDKGPPRPINIPLMPYVREFHIKNKRFRFIENATTTVKDELTLVVVNYGLLPKAVRYVRNAYTEYFKWYNIQKTLWTKAADIANKSNRQQYIFVGLPDVLPSISKLDLHASRFTQDTVNSFKSANGWFVLELWKWLSEEYRNNSVIGDMSQEQLAKINIVYQESGRFVLLNLGVLNSWRYLRSEGADAHTGRVKIDPANLQRRFLRMLMSLMGVRSVSSIMDAEIQENVDGEVLKTPDRQDTAVPIEDSAGAQATIRPEDIDTDETSKTQRAAELLSSMDEDLAELEVIEKSHEIEQREQREGSETVGAHNVADFESDMSPEEVITSICDDLGENGLLTVAEYKRYRTMAENYKHILAPNGKQTLGDYATISADELAITESKKIPDISTVIDKTMLKSSLLEFDEKYIKTIMQRDIAAMVVNSQKGGFVINKYEVERTESILGKYDIHTVRITPIEGMPGTLRFKLPVIDADGTYSAKGIRYTMRKQRSDASFRKTGPDRVALTSYFGKTFVTRSDKKVYDRGQWLRDQVMAKGMDQFDTSITNPSPANVFDNSFDAGRAYTSIAMGLKSFEAKGYNFIFDRHSASFNPKIAEKYNKDGNVVVAVDASGNHLVMDKANALYQVTPTGLDPVGSFEGFLGIDTLHSPVDFAQVKIYGKNLPVGLVLGYMYGLDKLLDMLKVAPRRVPTGQRVNLQDHEFSVTFSDETLVFSRDDAMASMVFGGFKEYEKSLRNYSVHTFDKPNVYLNVLESQGIGSRYLREIEMFNSMFVDPITKDLLKADNLPQSFSGLLVKSVEQLLTDTHPDSNDMAHMRIKGYERMAGAVYAEICQAVREHKSRSGRAHQAIDLHPQAVWMRIAKDPSVTVSSDINPIKNIKEREAVTYNGVGGRTSRSMTRSTRAYHPNDMGVISESTVDNSDVAINTYMSADPQLNSLRGTSNRYVIGETGATALMSTPALLSVGSNHDD